LKAEGNNLMIVLLLKPLHPKTFRSVRFWVICMFGLLLL